MRLSGSFNEEEVRWAEGMLSAFVHDRRLTAFTNGPCPKGVLRKFQNMLRRAKASAPKARIRRTPFRDAELEEACGLKNILGYDVLAEHFGGTRLSVKSAVLRWERRNLSEPINARKLLNVVRRFSRDDVAKMAELHPKLGMQGVAELFGSERRIVGKAIRDWKAGKPFPSAIAEAAE